MMSGHDPNPIVFKNKKIKTRRPEHSLTLPPTPPTASTSDNISFLLCRANFRCSDETCTYWIFIHFKNAIHKRKSFSFSVTLKPDCLICSLFSAAGIQLHLKEVFFDFHISE